MGWQLRGHSLLAAWFFTSRDESQFHWPLVSFLGVLCVCVVSSCPGIQLHNQFHYLSTPAEHWPTVSENRSGKCLNPVQFTNCRTSYSCYFAVLDWLGWGFDLGWQCDFLCFRWKTWRQSWCDCRRTCLWLSGSVATQRPREMSWLTRLAAARLASEQQLVVVK